MKKILLIGTFLICGLAYGNDGDFQGKDNQEINKINNVRHEEKAISKQLETKDEIKFEKEVENQDRGHDRD